MERLAYAELLDWKQRGAKKPFFLLGARQVGKTYLIEQFLSREFDNHVTFTLSNRPDIVALFAEEIPTDQKFRQLELLHGETINPETTAIFFDEAQESEHVISAMKFFAESPIPYTIICAGSLLGVKISRFSQSFPVGKVELHHLHPMNFQEFLMAVGRSDMAAAINDSYHSNTALADPVHRLCLELYRTYLIVGGMPEAVADVVAHDGDVLAFDRRIITDIRQSYLADMAKYILSPQEAIKISAIYQSIPAQLGNASKKFQYSAVNKGARGRSYESALEWLVASGMAYRTEMVTRPTAPLKGFMKDGFFKLFLNDTGILCDLLGIRIPALLLDDNFLYKGVIAENYVACQLASIGQDLFYWRDNDNAEIDFLLDTASGVLPIEVKAGTRVSSTSLNNFMKTFKPPAAIRVSAKNFGFEDNIKSVPLYATWCLAQES